MFAADFDPYQAQHRLHWRNRWAQWRGQPGESTFHGLALLAVLVLATVVLISQRDASAQWLSSMLDAWQLQCALVVWMLLALDHAGARRRQRHRWRVDWLSAQPVSSRTRRKQCIQQFALRVSLHLLLLGLLLALAQARLVEVMVAVVGTVLSAGAGNLAGGLDLGRSAAGSARQTPFVARGAGRLWRWQLIEAGASLAPRRVAWMLPVVLLVPRGPAMMAMIALGLVLLVAAVTGWQRMLAVIPLAHAWLREQPIATRHWVPRSMLLPLLLLACCSALLSLAAFLLDLGPLFWICALALPGIGVLQVSIVAAERQRVRRIAMVLTVQGMLLAATLQALPMLMPLLWLAQVALFARKALRQ